METIICTFCSHNANYACSCKANYCNEHQLQHDSLLGDHKITNIQLKYRIVNPKAKLEVINKIIQVKNEASIQIQNLLQKTNIFILELNRQLSKTIKQTREFLKLCENIIIEIQGINNIEDKEFYTPLENALLSFNNSSILNLIFPPLIEFPENTFKILYLPSTFPHYFYNYSDYSIQFSTEHSIQFIPSNNTIKNAKFASTSRYLNVGYNKILFTGGSITKTTSVFLFDLIKKKIENYPNLINDRK